MKLIRRNGLIIGPVRKTIKCGKYNLKERLFMKDSEDSDGDFWGDAGLFVGWRLVWYHDTETGEVIFRDEFEKKFNNYRMYIRNHPEFQERLGFEKALVTYLLYGAKGLKGKYFYRKKCKRV